MTSSQAELMAAVWSLIWALPGFLIHFWAVELAAAITLLLVVTSPRV